MPPRPRTPCECGQPKMLGRNVCSTCAVLDGTIHATQAKHGNRSRYTAGCRCSKCKQAQAEYMRRYYVRRAERPDPRKAYQWTPKRTA